MTARSWSRTPFDEIVPALRAGVIVADRVFDAIYPAEIRALSARHWSPVAVAVHAARFLAASPAASVLDVGSGVGKFCIVAAAVTGARVRGIERRAHLVAEARSAADRLGVNVDLAHGMFEDEEPWRFDGLFLFNPFGENLWRGRLAIDQSVSLGRTQFNRDVALCEAVFKLARSGTRVATFCGFGGEMPSGWRCVSEGVLELWEKR